MLPPTQPHESVRPPLRAFVAIGSNVGDRRAHVDFAIKELGGLPMTRLVAVSEILETEPVGPGAQGKYLNAAAQVATGLEPRPLLEALLDIERRRGRDRAAEGRWGPRTLDLDLLLYGDRVINEPGLCVPHPRLHERLFVLEPLAQIAAGTLVPGRGWTVAELLADRRAQEQGTGSLSET